MPADTLHDAFGRTARQCVKWFRDREIPLYAINENPSQQRWTSSPKIHADLYIDDSNLGCPIRFVDGVKRPVADWTKDQGAAGTGGISGLTGRPQVVRRLRNRFPTVVKPKIKTGLFGVLFFYFAGTDERYGRSCPDGMAPEKAAG